MDGWGSSTASDTDPATRGRFGCLPGMKKRILLTLTLVALTAVFCSARADRHQLGERSYLLHVPPGLKSPAPLVLALHGGGGTGAQFERWTKFSQLADREGFLVAYPDGIGKNWNDGRQDVQAQAFRDKVDDVAFLRAVVDDVARQQPVDRSRIYATGASNGGFMSSRLGIECPDLFAAVAPVIGGIPEGLQPTHPMPVLIIQGTEDPLVPYNGGEVNAFGSKRGRLHSTDESVELWCAANGLQGPARVESLPDTDPQDGCHVERHDYGAVRLYKVIGGGHTWPGAGQYLPQRFIGRVCNDLNGTETVWAFFREFKKT